MHKDLLIAIFAGLGAMFGWGFSDFFAKKTVNKIGDYSTLFWSQLIGIFPLLLVFIFSKSMPVISGIELLIVLGFGLLDATSWFFLYRGFQKGEVSLLSPIFASYTGLVVIISAFIFGEIIPTLRWFSLGVIFIGIILSSIEVKRFKRKKSFKKIKGLPEIIFALFQYAIWVALWGNFIHGKEWVAYLILVRAVVTASIGATCLVKKITLTIKDNLVWKFLIFIGLFDVTAYSLVSLGFSKTTYISIVAMLSGAFSLPTIILAHFFLKEKLSKIQAIGSIVIIAGIIILSV